MTIKKTTIALVALLIAALAAVAWAAAGTAKHVGIEGTYKFASRVKSSAPDKPVPGVVGMQTFTKEYRNFNVSWKDASGKTFSYSVISKYTLTDSTYTETKLYSIMDDEIGGTGVKCDYDPKSETTKVTMENGKVTFKLPFDPVTITFDGRKATAVADDKSFTDQWTKVQ